MCSINYCNDCKGSSCNNCNKDQDNKHPDHNNNKLKLSVKKPDEEELPLKWNQCKIDLNSNEPIQNCSTCKNLCNK